MSHKSNKDRNEYNRYYRNTEKFKEQQKLSKDQRTFTKKCRTEANYTSYLKHLLISCKTRKSGCTLTLDDLLNQYHKQNGLCAICGVQMAHKQRTLFSISIDRIDNTLGYTPDNIQLVTKCMNLGRNTASIEEIKDFINQIRAK